MADGDLVYTDEELKNLTKEELIKTITDKANAIVELKAKILGENGMREFERVCLLRNVDTKWMDHIDAMEELRRGMGLRGYGSHDPVAAYRTEGFEMFDEMVEAIKQDTGKISCCLEDKNLCGTYRKTAGCKGYRHQRRR